MNSITANPAKEAKKQLHTNAVRESLASYGENKVLHRNPPQVHSSESKLSRNFRVKLTQLRSGYSRSLNSYMHRIDENIEDKCPDCSEGPHDTEHLFNCKENPTTLTTLDLWTNPIEAAKFLFKLDVGPPPTGWG